MLKSGQQIFRTLLIGQVLYMMTNIKLITPLFAILSLQNIDIQTDFFSILTLIGYIITTVTLCINNYLVSQKKQNINLMFLENICLFLSFSIGSSILVSHSFGKLSPYAIDIVVGIGKLFYEINTKDMKEKSQDDIANEAFGRIGAQITHGQSWFEINQKRYGIIANILNIVLTLTLSLLSTYYGKITNNFIMYIIISVSGFGIMLVQTFITKSVLSNKKIKDIIIKQKPKKQQLLPQKQDDIENKHQEQKQEQIEEQTFKSLINQIKIIDKINIIYTIICLIITFSLNYIRKPDLFNTTFSAIYNSIGLVISSIIIAKVLIYQHKYLLIGITLILCLCNYNLPLQQVIYNFMQLLIRNNEKLPLKQYVILFASSVAMALTNQSDFNWTLNLIYSLIVTVIQIVQPYSQQIPQRIMIALQYFLIDTFISFPRSAYKNTIVNCIIILCCYQYKSFSAAIMGQVSAQVQFISIVIRCSINAFNMLTLGDDNTNTICQKIVLYNGIFSIILTTLLQISTFTRVKETINTCQISISIILWVIIAGLVAVLPINITPVVILLYVTNYVVNVSSASQFSTLSILVYQAFNQNDWTTFNSNDIFMILARIYTGIMVSSITLYLLQRKNQSKLNQFWLLQMCAGFISLYLSMPSVITNYNDFETIGWFNVIVSIVIYLLVSCSVLIKLNSKIAKILIGVIYTSIIVYASFTKHYAEGSIMFLTLMCLAFAPQSAIIVAIILGYLMMIMFLTTKYTIVKMTHQTVFQTIAIISTMWLLRYQLVKQSCLRRLTKKAKIEMPNCRVNSQAFNVNEQELDIFLQLQDQTEQSNGFYNEDAQIIIRQLGWQMKVFVFITCIMLYNIGFLSNVSLLLSLSCLLIPIVTYNDEKKKVLRIAGYFSQQGGYEINQSDKQQLVEQYSSISYDLINIKILFDIIGYIIYYNNEKADITFSTGVIIDLALLPIILLLSFISFTLICQKPQTFYSFLVEQQVEKIKVVVSIVCILLSLFTTDGAIKVLAAWTCLSLLVDSKPIKKKEIIEYQAQVDINKQIN